MSTTENMLFITVQAGADLSASLYRFGVVAADGQVDPVGTAGADADGVIMNKPTAAGQPTQLAVGGVAKVVVGTGGVTAGAKLQSDATGKAITAASTKHVVGKALATGAAGDIIPVLLVSKHILA